MKPCEICAGNDGDMPCVYPSKCLRDQRRIDELLKRVEVLEAAAGNFLKDLEERVKRDGEYHPDEAVMEYLGHGKTLPVGNGVLFMLDEALKGGKG